MASTPSPTPPLSTAAQRSDAQRPGSFPVFADLGDCAADPPVLRAHGVDGATVYRGDGRAGLVRGQLLAVKDKPVNSLGCAVLEIAAGDHIGLALDGLFGLAHGNR